jgi:type I restriction enzyme, S subunit
MKAGWQIKKLGDLFDITSSKRVFESDWKRKGVPFYRAREIVKLANQGFVDNELFISEEMFDAYSVKYGIPQNGDIMVTGVGTLGVCYVVKENDKFYFKDGNIIWLKRKSDTSSRFVEYAFQSDFLRKQIDDSVGATVGTYTIIKAKDTLIPVPPLPEQQRIVTILDEAFEGIANARANAEKNLQNAHTVFESHLQSVFTQRGEGWVDQKLGEVCVVERGSSPRPIKNFFTTAPDGVNWVKIGDTKEGEKYVYSTAQKITHEGAKQSRFVKENDFILTNSMSFGRPYIMKTSGYIHDGWFVLRLNRSLNLDYFYYILASDFVRSQFNRLASGAIVLNISSDLVKQAVLPIPPMAQQDGIAEKLKCLSAETRRLESIYQRKLAALEELKKSLLNQAFTGAL